ncbi:MAG: FhaA domain-containing protein [Candidatus Limnocylindria bacterium]
MAIVSAIESFLERLFEAPIGRLFGARMQPIALAKRIERLMDTNRTFTNDGILVPNAYQLSLNPADYAVFESYRSVLEDDLAREVLGRARRERYTLVGRPRVHIVSDDATRRGEIRISATLVDDRAVSQRSDDGQPLSSDTRVFAAPSPPPPPQPGLAAPRPYLIVHREAAPPLRFDLGGPLISIGRGAENDLILDDAQVSRHHCQLKLQQGAYSLTDMGSTNGSYVNGQRISEIALGPGDIIELGGTRIEFQVRG